MKIITTATEMSVFSAENRSKNKIIGFIPTMGALHNGHISLVREAKRNCDLVVVSVFVNPTQFNSTADLEKYPRTFEQDKEVLSKSGVDVMFYPSIEEVYPSNKTAVYDLDGLDDYMEGPNRPGHFNGVVQVVTRLFDMVQPHSAFFGEKDFQQLAILKHMSAKLGYEIKIVGCQTIRESSGLAMSSRNQRLSENGLVLAASIYRILKAINADLRSGNPSGAVKTSGLSELNKLEGLKLEYLELVNPGNLKPVSENSEAIQACVAVWIEGVRLIDNMRVK